MRSQARAPIVAALIFVATTARAATGVGFVASPFQRPGVGADVVVALTGTDMDGVTSMDLHWAYDAAVMTPTGVFLTDYSNGFSLTSNLQTPGVVALHLVRPSALTGSGEIAWVTFRIAAGVSPGTATLLSWTAAILNGGTMACARQGKLVTVGSAPTATISAPRGAYGAHGAQVVVPISVDALGGGSSFDLVLAFDSRVLTPASVQKTTFASCMSLVPNTSTAGTVRISMYGLCTVSGSGPIAIVTFNVVGPDGSRTPLNVIRGTVDEDHAPTVLADGLFNTCSTPDVDGDGYSACAGDCNDANGAIHPGATESCNAVDDDCDGTVDNALPPTEAPVVKIDKEFGNAFLSWGTSSTATAYDVIRGDVSTLQSNSGNFAASAQFCLGSQVTTNDVLDTLLPPVGDGFWYLVRPANCGGSGSYDELGAHQAAPRDPAIAASPYRCP